VFSVEFQEDFKSKLLPLCLYSTCTPHMPEVELHPFISAMQYAMNAATSVQYWPTTPHTTKPVSANTLPTPAASSTEYQYPILATAEILTRAIYALEIPSYT